jgi:membrane-associated phospholipid phosphatase
MKKLNKNKFFIATIISLLLTAVLFYYSHTFGKEDFFLLLNKNEGSVADKLFYIFTFGGDALIWIPVLVIVIFLLKRKDAIVLLVAAFALSTIFVQGIKNLVPEDRPIKAITNTSLIHTVEGVEVHTINSFPSGHSTTAFCIYFIFCLLIKKRWSIVVGFIYAVTVGYSRIYLAQHFPFDVAGGIVTATISVWLSVFIQQYWWKRERV